LLRLGALLPPHLPPSSSWFCWPGLAPAGEVLLPKPAKRVFFVRQRRATRAGFAHFAKRSYANTKSTQKKGDPQSGSLRCATGNLRCSTAEGVWLNSLRCASLKQRQPLSLLRLRCSAQPGRGKRERGQKTNTKEKSIQTRTRHGVSLFLQVFGIFLPPPCVCAEERRFRRIRDRVV